MVSGHARVAQQKDPRKIKVFNQNKPVWSEVWENNPRIVGKNDEGDFQILYGRSLDTNMRPYHKSKTDRQYTYNLDYRPDVGELYFSPDEIAWGDQHRPYVIFEPTIKSGASPNKDWGIDKWTALSHHCKAEGIEVFQLGQRGRARLQGAKFIETPYFRLACAVLRNAKAILTHEGGLHHAAAALNIPGVVIMGGFTPVELTGYSMHRNLGASLGDACGMRIPCRHCRKWMDRITPQEVLKNLKEVLSANP